MSQALNPNEQREFLYTAIRAARAAAQIHQSGVGQDLSIATKSNETDLVTRIDKESEARIREILLTAYPEHVVLGEEEGQQGDAPYRWIVDPLDGTLNYAHGFPFYCVSVGLEVRGVLEVGVVLDSVRNELFTATRGGGALLKRCADCGHARRHLAPEHVGDRLFLRPGQCSQTTLRSLAGCWAVAAKVRRPGAAALDLAYVACGRIDGFWATQTQLVGRRCRGAYSSKKPGAG